MRSRAAPLALALALALAPPAVAQGSDRWFVGELDGVPCLAAREQRLAPGGDGEVRTAYDLELRIARPTPLHAREHHQQRESAGGELLAFRYETEEGVLAGRILREGGDPRVVATLWRGGEPRELELPVGQGVRVVGRAGQQALLASLERPGDRVRYATLLLAGEGLRVASQEATLVARGPTGRRVAIHSDLNPIELSVELNAAGELAEVRYDLQGRRMEIRATARAPALRGALLDRVAAARAEGPPPSRYEPVQRYALTEALAALVAEDEFQRWRGGVLEVSAEEGDGPPPASHQLAALSATPAGEDEAFATWVARVVGDPPPALSAIPQRLRDAVRTRIGPVGWGVADGSPAETFRRGQGDCSEVAGLLCAALRKAGLPARVEVGLVYQATHARWEAHAWVVGFDRARQRWLHLDATSPTLPRTLYVRVQDRDGGLVPTVTRLMVALDGAQSVRTMR